ncbi:TolC family protein [Xanthobacter sp. KR7-65]|uniref:TolC family protein n=1 Tax=Xanthobacter sp. KR7-65 TaxID=3156612 RepID=UPI0032B5E2BB
MAAIALRRHLAAPLLLLLGGCASFTPDGGMTPVANQVAGETGASVLKISSTEAAAEAQARVAALLSRPLDARAAAQIALLSNRGLQAQYNALGISEADYVAASLPPNPVFGVERLSGGGELDIERRLAANLLALLTLPARTEIAKSQFEAARQRAVEATFRTAAEARRAYYRAVAARQTEVFLESARRIADAAADLTVKLGETGAATKLDQARASAFYAEVSSTLAQARLASATEREALTRSLGLWGADTAFRLPSQLPRLPGRLRSVGHVEAEAVMRRTDLIAARLELDALSKTLGLTEATRFVSLIDGAYRSNYQRAGNETLRPSGFELEVQVPLFDLGETKVRRGAEVYMQAVNLLMEQAVNVRSEARAAYVGYRARYDIARQYQAKILPLRKIINEQALLQYNGMLIDVFELLTTERESIDSSVAAIAAQRDFFLAEVDFETAITGGGSGRAMVASAASPSAESD